MKYQEIKNQEPILEKCFFAFSNQQFAEGKEKSGITEEQIFDGGAGLYGTKEGLEKLRNYYTEREKRIAVECTIMNIQITNVVILEMMKKLFWLWFLYLEYNSQKM